MWKYMQRLGNTPPALDNTLRQFQVRYYFCVIAMLAYFVSNCCFGWLLFVAAAALGHLAGIRLDG
jgi:hypothetical protein